MKVKDKGTPPQMPHLRAPEPGAAGSVAPAPGHDVFGRGEPAPHADAEGPRASRVGLDTQGAGRNSVFAFRVRGEDRGVEDLIGRLPRVGADSIHALLAKLPLQTEVKRIMAAQAAPGPRIPYRPFEAMKADLPMPFVEALERLPALTARFNPVELYTADDVAALKERFLDDYKAGIRENPRFEYTQGVAKLRASLARDGTSPEAIKAELTELRAKIAAHPVAEGDDLAGLMKQAVLRKLDDDLSTVLLLEGLEGREEGKVKAALTTKYGAGVDDALYDAAKVVFGYLVETQAHASEGKKAKEGEAAPVQGNLPPALSAHLSKGESMSAAEFKDAVDWMLGRYYAAYEAKSGHAFPAALKYRVELDDSYSAIDVRDKSSDGPVIGIPDKARSPKKYLELLRHEIDMHARQSMNGHFMFGFAGGALKVDEETWYEGLAKHNEIELMREMFGDDSQPTMPYFTFAIRMAEEGKSFLEVFDAMAKLRMAAGSSEKLALSNAWNATYRVFRGHIDTANPDAYAMPKDQAYLRGWMLQAQLSERGLSHLNEAGIGPLDGPELLSRFDFGPEDLMFPDVNLTQAWFEEVLRPKAEAELAAKAEGAGGARPAPGQEP
ncbi:MAG: DUF1704 domain-containing protein [Deltaproteobacteria bacterium]|nr:DUF1704 domain-containing protein [Deltaproteobacteria bacterium]